MIIGFVLVAVSIQVIKFKKTGDLSWYVRVYCHREPQRNKKRIYCNVNITFPNNGPILAMESSGVDSPCRRPPLGGHLRYRYSIIIPVPANYSFVFTPVLPYRTVTCLP
jgi:hypothetical protein